MKQMELELTSKKIAITFEVNETIINDWENITTSNINAITFKATKNYNQCIKIL